MVKDIIRDSTLGYLVNTFSNGRLFPFADQREDYVVPQRYLQQISPDTSSFPRTLSSAPTLVASPTLSPADNSTLVGADGVCDKIKTGDDVEKQGGETPPPPSSAAEPAYPWLVTFEENDQDRPQNWSPRKKYFVGSLISLLTFAVYVGSAIYTSSIPGIMVEFNVSQRLATAGLTLFVAAYGFGPMLLSPIQEVPALGRNPTYLIGLALFVIFQVPPIFAKNIGTILVSRAIAGFVGSPSLSTGGASMSDIFPPHQLAIAIGTWAIGAVCGPIAGPVVGGFAVMAENWRWSFLILLWASGFAFIVLFITLPETYEPTILYRRAQRLRKLTGNQALRAPCEVGDKRLSLLATIGQNIKRAIRLMTEPAILVANIYIALVYAIFYLWFEAFPLVFNDIYGFSLGIGGLPYLGFVVSAAITFTGYVIYQRTHIVARMERGPLAPEVRLEIALFASVFIPISLLMFGWSAGRTHWIVPVIGAALYLPGIFLAFQGILMFLSMSYAQYAASLLAGNALFRSVFASVFPLFGASFFNTLGLGGGSSLLAGVSILMIPVLYAIIHFGARLRARSNFAE